MLNLTVAALFLIGTHFGIASTACARELVARIGERAYRALYSLAGARGPGLAGHGLAGGTGGASSGDPARPAAPGRWP